MKFSLFFLALVATVAVTSAAIAPPPPCVWGDGVCARVLTNTYGRWAIRNPHPQPGYVASTGYGLIADRGQLSPACLAELGLGAQPSDNIRFTFDFSHNALAGVHAVWNAAAKTLKISGTVYGGPVIGHYTDAGYTAARYACSDTGFYKLDYTYINVEVKPNGDLEIIKSSEDGTTPNGSGSVKKVGAPGPVFDLGIQHHLKDFYAFRLTAANGDGIGWTDTIGAGGPGSKTGLSRDFHFNVDPNCDCDPEDPGSDCKEEIASSDCESVTVTTDGKCVCLGFSADGNVITVPCN